MPPSVFEGYAGRRPGEGEDGRKEPPERPLLLWAFRLGGVGGIPESASGRDRKAAFLVSGEDRESPEGGFFAGGFLLREASGHGKRRAAPFSPVPRMGGLLGSGKKGVGMNGFKKAHAFTSRWEGGFVKHPSDPGGATKYGVSLRFLREQGLDTGDVDRDGDIDEEDVRALTPALAARVLRRNFWDVFPLDNVQPLCAMVVYDTAVNMGVSYAKKMAQQALGLQADGRWGPLTWAALKSCDDRKTAAAMCHIRRARYCELARNNPALAPFLNGWLRRADALEETVETA